jgi:sigma-E factor negative regulatory protein RseB
MRRVSTSMRHAVAVLAAHGVLLTAVPAVADDARSRLTRMQSAAAERNYRGTMVSSSAGLVSSSRVAHFSVGAQSYEVIESLDGRMQQVLRHNELVHTVWPASGVVVVERREAPQSRSPLLQSVDARALEQYQLRVEGRQRLAGRDAEVLLLVPRDALRYAQRLWADQVTGLMLRAEILAADKSVLESSGFSSIEIDIKPQPELVLEPMRRLTQYRVLRAQQEPARLDAEGWVMVRQLAGFQYMGCVRRPLEAVVDGDGKPPEKMLQAVFSDGLTHLSLFVERFDERRHRKEVQAQIGATATLMQRRGEHWLTAMGDVPPATLRALLEGLERRP